MFVSLLQLEKASFPMWVTDLPSIVIGITNLPDAHSSQRVIVTSSPLIQHHKCGLTNTTSAGLVSGLLHPPRTISSGSSSGYKNLFSPQPYHHHPTAHKGTKAQGRVAIAHPAVEHSGKLATLDEGERLEEAGGFDGGLPRDPH